MKKIHTDVAPVAIGPYSQAIEVNGFLFASGQTPLIPGTGALLQGGIAEQTEQVIHNLGSVLAAAGSDFSQVVKTTCFLKSMDDFAVFNEVYAKYFTERPARSCVAVSALPRDALVEIELIATIDVSNKERSI